MHTDEAAAEAIELAESSEPRLCPDCGTLGLGEYCPHCGEQMEMHLFSVKHYLKEIFHEFAVLDTKFFRTIPALLFKPGFLSREYIAGRRKRYLSPARLYTLIAFFSFFALGYYLSHELKDLFSLQLASHGAAYIQVGKLKGADAMQYAETWLKFILEVSPYMLLLGATPMFALSLKVLYWKRRMLYAEHLVFSFHFYAFSLIILIGSLFFHSNYCFFAAQAIFMVYLYVGLKRFYQDRGFLLIARLIGCTVAYFNIAIFAILLTLAGAWLLGYQMGELPPGAGTFKFTM